MSRFSNKDKRHFLVIARGSCAELRTQVYIGIEIGYINEQQGRQWLQETRDISAMLHGLITTLSDEHNTVS